MTQLKFLLIDDNPIDLMVNERLLQNAFNDCSVTSFSNALEALEFLKDNRGNAHLLPQVILLDLIMPRLDGFQIVDELEKTYSVLPFKVFLLSATMNEADFSNANENKWVESILNKPLEIEVLKNLI